MPEIIDVRAMYPGLDEACYEKLELLTQGRYMVLHGGKKDVREIQTIQEVLLVQKQMATVLVGAGIADRRRDDIYTNLVLPMLHSVIGRDPGYNAIGTEAMV